MLKFKSLSKVESFLAEIEKARVDHEGDIDTLGLRSDIDPRLYEIEDKYGYRSLCYLYDSLEYDDDDFRTTAKTMGVIGVQMDTAVPR